MKKLIKFLIISSFLILGSQVLADWTQFQYNAQHTGKSEDSAPQNGELEWSLSFNSDISPFSSPSIGLFNGIKLIFLGTDNGLYLIDPNGIIVDSILTVEPVETVIAINENIIYFGCGDTLIAYLPSERFWSHEIGENISHVTIFENSLYVSGGDKLWNFDLDGTLNWMTDTLGGGIYNSAPAIDQFGNIYVATLGDASQWYDFKLYAFNSDGTERWNFEFLGLEPGGIKVSPTIDENGNIYVATCWEFGWFSSLFSINTDGEQNWRTDAEILYSSLALSDDYLCYGTRQGIIARSFDGDFLWQFITPSEISHSSPAIDSSNTVYIGTDEGVFIALNSQGELQWGYDTQEEYLSSPIIDSNMVYVASSQSLFAFKDVPSSIDEIEISNISLNQNYPNPFNPITTISFQLKESGVVNLSIYNIKGQIVKTLVNNQLSAGEYTIIWNGENNSSGIYFYKMKQGIYTSTKKMILMK